MKYGKRVGVRSESGRIPLYKRVYTAAYDFK